eukprot:gnl/MRDRNA2_/MRDRNA2_128647_c0_seq1.p1 gnl/MRDRNA2_/MRDRNA2_128647_c0~~gnl/MRDRNA2_/MRDRNA2_128647_c0_seq1.p1  ORF type:complete len:389 (+),score=66.60 gnl/MRDRNA2_/MRDRNA2_128647_c0_seq1:58-1224(+)
MSDAIVPERRWQRHRNAEHVSETANGLDHVTELEDSEPRSCNASSLQSQTECTPSADSPNRSLVIEQISATAMAGMDCLPVVSIPDAESPLDSSQNASSKNVGLQCQQKSAASADTLKMDTAEDTVALLPRDRLRWKRQGDSRKTGPKEFRPMLQENDTMSESATSCAIQGLCPKSKLSFSGSARLLQAPSLANDFASVLQGGAHHLKAIFCPADERKLFEQLRAEIQDSGLWRSRWGSKGKDSYEWTIAPEGGQRSTGRITGEDAVTLAKLPAHSHVLERLASLFNVVPLSWWINLYPGGRDGKNFHKDNFGQNITIGASFGATRNLTFRHGTSRDEFHFPQENGDVFAFRERVNNAFLHGMHPLRRDETDPGPRISVIMMGRAKDQ